MIPIRKKSYYQYVFRLFYKQRGIYIGYRYTVNGKVVAPRRYFEIKLDTKTKHFFVHQKDFKMRNGNFCHEVIYCTERPIKED